MSQKFLDGSGGISFSPFISGSASAPLPSNLLYPGSGLFGNGANIGASVNSVEVCEITPEGLELKLNGTSALPSLAFGNDLSTGMYTDTSGSIAIATSATKRAKIDSAGIAFTQDGSATNPNVSSESSRNTGTAITSNSIIDTVSGNGILTTSSQGISVSPLGTQSNPSIAMQGGNGFYVDGGGVLNTSKAISAPGTVNTAAYSMTGYPGNGVAFYLSIPGFIVGGTTYTFIANTTNCVIPSCLAYQGTTTAFTSTAQTLQLANYKAIWYITGNFTSCILVLPGCTLGASPYAGSEMFIFNNTGQTFTLRVNNVGTETISSATAGTATQVVVPNGVTAHVVVVKTTISGGHWALFSG